MVTYSIPLLDSIAERFECNTCVLDEVRHDVFAQPSTIRVLEYQWCVPMVQSHRWLNTILNASVDQVVVVVNGQLIDWPATEGQDTRPRQREAVNLHALSSKARDVLFVKIVVLLSVSFPSSISMLREWRLTLSATSAVELSTM